MYNNPSVEAVMQYDNILFDVIAFYTSNIKVNGIYKFKKIREEFLWQITMRSCSLRK